MRGACGRSSMGEPARAGDQWGPGGGRIGRPLHATSHAEGDQHFVKLLPQRGAKCCSRSAAGALAGNLGGMGGVNHLVFQFGVGMQRAVAQPRIALCLFHQTTTAIGAAMAKRI